MNQVRWIIVDYHQLEHPMGCDTLAGEVGDHYRNCMDRVTIISLYKINNYVHSTYYTCTCAHCENSN